MDASREVPERDATWMETSAQSARSDMALASLGIGTKQQAAPTLLANLGRNAISADRHSPRRRESGQSGWAPCRRVRPRILSYGRRRECPRPSPFREVSGPRCVGGVDRGVRRFALQHRPRRGCFVVNHGRAAHLGRCVGEEDHTAGAFDDLDPNCDDSRGSRAGRDRAINDRLGRPHRSRCPRRRRSTGHTAESVTNGDDTDDRQATYDNDDDQTVRSVATHRPERHARRHACTASRRRSVGA